MKKGFNKKWLIIALICLTMVIVGLIIGITLVRMNTAQQINDDEVTHEELANGNYDVGYNISSNISAIYNTESKEKALDLYERELKLALDSKDYELFMNLVNARATMLILDDRCEDALAAFDNTNMDGLPDEIKMSIYSVAAMNSNTCKDEAREERYTSLYNSLAEKNDSMLETYEQE